MKTVQLTMAQALVRFLAAQQVREGGVTRRLFEGVWAIFGHGNVAGMGHALHEMQEELPTFRAHNEQAMAHAAVAFAKASRRRRMMACTTSIGPGATNLVTAAAGAHINRLPVLLLPGDTFSGRGPDPVLQQLEDFGEVNLTVNDCLRPVSRLFDRIQRPEQLLSALPRAMQVLTDPAQCGPVTLALPQDVQTEAYAYPEDLFAPQVHHLRRPRPDRRELARALAAVQQARRPLIVVGGGVLYSEAEAELADFAAAWGAPMASTQAGHGAVAWDHPNFVGGLGVTGSAAANRLAQEADLILAVGTRLSDFTTASRTLFEAGARVLAINVNPMDASKHRAVPLLSDALEAVQALHQGLGTHRADPSWTLRALELKASWAGTVAGVCMAQPGLPTDAQVVGAVNAALGDNSVVVGAAGGLPGELHKLYQPPGPGTYHLEYGYSCMGYEIAGGLGVKMAHPEREVVVLVGDGSYLMMNSELATSVSTGHKLTVVLLDNHGFGCIHRLQGATGAEPFNNLRAAQPDVDYVAHAAALGAHAEKVDSIEGLRAALTRCLADPRTCVIVIETDPDRGTPEGGAWWEVAVPEVSPRAEVQAARRAYDEAKAAQAKG